MAILSGNVFNVKDLSPALWLDAADSSTLFDATVGGNLVSDGGAVARWEDKSGNGRHATQSDSTRRPLRVIGAQNTRDSLRFDGINDFLTCGDTLDVLTNGVTLLCVAKFNNTGNGGLLGKSNPGTSVGRYSIIRASGLLQGFATFNTTGSGTGNSVNVADTSTNLRLLSFRSTRGTTSTSTLKINGRTVATSNYTGTTTSYDTTDQFFIGSYQNSTGPNTGALWPANADICEALVFLRDLTDVELQSIERYLANKWGLGFNPLSLSPALWLDASDSSTLYDATSGGNLVAAGGAVARWEDKSGNGRHATQATLASRPLRTIAAQGGKDALTFDGNDALFTSSLNTPSAQTLFAVVRANSWFPSSDYRYIYSHGHSEFSGGIGVLLTVAASRDWLANDFFAFGSGYGLNQFPRSIGPIFNGNNYRLITSNLGSSSATGYINSTRVSTRVEQTGSIAPISSPISIGSNGATVPSQYWIGNIAEIIVYNSILTNVDRIAVERYLAKKWNIIP